ncbi:FG-GAP-like repeat-containing protein, partial [Parafrankia sp. EUN1f]|uniref:FG-GAP-like repeat-containing protein n=1 Tax=Parafrankia sp. EUN1f TaxID=102897 RepID=UPI0001C47047
MRKHRAFTRTAILACAVVGLCTTAATPSLADTTPAYSHDSTIGLTNTDWMSSLADSMRLSQLSVPGTHDSGASVFGGDSTETQSMSLETQLNSGIRAWDIRLSTLTGLAAEPLTIWHGPAPQLQTFKNYVLGTADRFLAAHPTETILMRVKDEGSGGTPNFAAKVQADLAEYPRVYSDTKDNPFLGDIRGKIVVLQNFDSENRAGIPWSSLNIQDNWKLKTNWDLADKWHAVEAQLRAADAGPGSTTYVNFLSGATGSFPYFVASGHSSPQTGAPRLATGWTRGVIDTCKHSAACIPEYPGLNCFLGTCTVFFEGTNILTMKKMDAQQGAHHRYGIVYADFPGAGLIQAVINANAGAPALDWPPQEVGDVNGDGRADIVGFGEAAVHVSLGQADSTFTAPKVAVKNFGPANGWQINRHPRELGDVNGDGRADIVGFGEAGVYVSLGQADGTFTDPRLVVSNFRPGDGWQAKTTPRELADINGDDRADIVGFGGAGVWLSLGQADGTFTEPKLVINNFGHDAGGWRVETNPRELADINGDDRADIVGFGNAGVIVSLGQADGTFTDPRLVVSNFRPGDGWQAKTTPRELADINGDDRADIVGFGGAGVWLSLGQADGTFTEPKLVINNFAQDAGGWRVETNPRELADINGDDRADIVGFGNAGVIVSLGQTDGTFTEPKLVINNFAQDAGGWRVETNPRELADINGDDRADIVGFGNAGVIVSLGQTDGTFT